MEDLIKVFWSSLVNFAKGLEWAYIISFLLITWLSMRFMFSKEKTELVFRLFKRNIHFKKKWWAWIVGIVIAVVYAYFMNNLTKDYVKQLFESYLFAQVFHIMFLNNLQYKFDSWINKKMSSG